MARKKSKLNYLISYYIDKDCQIKTYSNRIYHSASATYNNLYRYRLLASLEVYEDMVLIDKIDGRYWIKKYLEQVIYGYLI